MLSNAVAMVVLELTARSMSTALAAEAA